MREIDLSPFFSQGEFLRHAAVKRTRAVKRKGGRYVLKFRGSEFRQKVFHPRRFNLEYPHGRAFTEQSVDLRIIKRNFVQVEHFFAFFLVFPDVLYRLVDYSEGFKAEEIEFHVTQLFYGVHVELGYDLVLASLV